MKDEIWMNYGNKIKEDKLIAITNGLKCNKWKVLIFFPRKYYWYEKIKCHFSTKFLPPQRGTLCQEGAAEDKSSTEKSSFKT